MIAKKRKRTFHRRNLKEILRNMETRMTNSEIIKTFPKKTTKNKTL
jgi:hypothetical protein